MDSDLEAYQQAFETLRHFSNLRFAMVTVFVTISGGLFYFALGRAQKLKYGVLFVCAAGSLIAVAFGVMEWRINEILEFYATKTVALGQQLKMSDLAVSRPSRGTSAARLAEYSLRVIYFGTAALWIGALIVTYAVTKRPHQKGRRARGHGSRSP